MQDTDHPLSPVVDSWFGRIERAKKAKQPFQDDADECMDFFSGPYDFMWNTKYKRKPWSLEASGVPPNFQMTINKVFELVALFGPVLYHHNPVRTVTPRPQFEMPREFIINPALEQQAMQMGQQAQMMDQQGMEMDQALQANPMLAQDPMFVQQYQQFQMQRQQFQMQFQPVQMQFQQAQMQYDQIMQQANMSRIEDKTRAELLSMYLNYTPNELELAKQMRFAITEALIKGRGCLVTEPYQPPDSTRRLVGSFFDSVDNWQIDPDAEKIDDALWMAQSCVHPTWMLERDHGLPNGSLKGKGHYESAWQQGEMKADGLSNSHRAGGASNDLIQYWKVWSKMGIGGRSSDMLPELKDALEVFGDYTYVVIAKDVPYPLNLPSSMFGVGATDEEYMERVGWPVPFWKDDRWPVTFIDFYDKPRSVWPISPIQPGLGELKFINYAMSWLANRVKTSCRDFIAHPKAMADELVTALESGKDMTLLAVEAAHGGVGNVVAFLQQPQVNRDIWEILTAVMAMFDKRVGLTELLYGMSAVQNRSATEVRAKQENISIRPDYMASRVEDGSTELSRKEGMAVRLFVEAEDVVPVVGPIGAQVWSKLVNEADLDKVVAEMEYRVESGSAKKPNREKEISNMEYLTPMILPVLQGHAVATGDTGPMNNWFTKIGKAIDQDLTGIFIPPRPPMPPPQPEQQQQGNQAQPKKGQAA